MLNAIFSFRGRIGRLAFAGWLLAATFLVFVIGLSFLLLGSLLAGMLSAGGIGPRIIGVLMAFVAVLIGIWIAVALQAKRIRDIGLNPLPWMLGISIAMVADQWLLTPLTGLRFFPPLGQYTPVAGLLAFAYMLVLLCWPGVTEAAEAETPVETAVDVARPERAPVMSAPSSALLLATPSQAAGRTEFGLPN